MAGLAILLSGFAGAANIPGGYPVPFARSEKPAGGSVSAGPAAELTAASDGIGGNGVKLLIPATPGGNIQLISKGVSLVTLYYAAWTPYYPWICSARTKGDSGLRDAAVSRQDGQYLYTGKIPMNRKGDAPVLVDYRQQIELEKNGRIRFTITVAVPKELAASFKSYGVGIELPWVFYQGTECRVNGKTIRFPSEKPEKNNAFLTEGLRGKDLVLQLNPVNAASYTVTVSRGASVGLISTPKLFMVKMMPDEQNQLVFSFDLGNFRTEAADRPKAYAGIDFQTSDRLDVPDYTECRNLLSNPSFEAGLRYYTFGPGIGSYEPGYEDKYTVDHTVGKFGKSSLRIKTLHPVMQFDMIRSFAYPVKNGADYTLSFYAKASSPGLGLDVVHTGDTILAKEIFPKGASNFRLTTDWKRYAIPFLSKSKGYAFSFQAPDNVEDGKIWIDGIQLEEGNQATDYVEKPVCAFLTTSAPDNFLTPEDKIDGILQLRTASPGRKGETKVSVRDFFYRDTDLGSFAFTTDDAGSAAIPLPLDKCLHGKKGVFVVRAETVLDGGRKNVDYFRFSVMDKMHGTHKNKGIFSFQSVMLPRCDAWLQRWEDIGLGSTNYMLYTPHDPRLFKLLEKHHIEFTGKQIEKHWGRPEGEITIQPYGAGTNRDEKVLASGFHDWDKVTPEREKMIEQAAYEYAGHYSWIHDWYLQGECKLRFKVLRDEKNEDFARLLVAVAKGVKRASPENQAYLTGGASHLTFGLGETEDYLKAVEKVAPGFKFDRIAIHAYNDLPENPDIDAGTKAFLDMLKAHGYGDVPVYYNEGGYWTPYNIPEWGLTSYDSNSMDHYHLWNPSYDMGWGERISAAFSVRGWLAALKYADRVKQYNLWRPWIYLDCDLKPMAIQKAANTLARLLGNADFVKDIRFAPESRSYLFRDADGCPVAAVWGYNESVDRGLKAPPVAELKFAPGKTPRVIDLMEDVDSSAEKDGTVRISLGPFPVFLNGRPGETASMEAALNNAVIADGSAVACPLEIRTDLTGSGLLDVVLRNQLSRNLVGIRLELDAPQGKIIRSDLTIPGNRSCKVGVKLSEPIADNRLMTLHLPYFLKIGDNSYRGDIDCSAFAVNRTFRPIKIDGDLSDWKDFPFIKMENRNNYVGKMGWIPRERIQGEVGYPGDFEAEFKAAWDPDYLYLGVRVTDDKFVHEKYEIASSRWHDDCLQLYLDTLNNGKDKSTQRMDEDDYNYDFFPEVSSGTMLVYRRFAPNMQLIGGLAAPKANTFDSTVKTAFRLTPDGYVYEIALPRNRIAPIRLQQGSVFGLGLYLPDRDDKNIKGALTLTPSGTTCYLRPNLWPTVILR